MSAARTLMQCDFDGTVTLGDVSFAILEKFAEGDWQRFLRQYREGKITAAGFNTKAFRLVKASEKAQLDYILSSFDFQIRPGLPDLLDYCARNRVEFVIVSNGLEYYIRGIMTRLGLDHIGVHAAKSRSNSHGMKVNFIGPDGKPLKDSFKEAYVQHFRAEGYRVMYVGNGESDLAPARLAHYIFATGELLASCRQLNIKHMPFEDFYEVSRGLENLLKG